MNAAEAFASSARLPIVRAGHVGFDQLVMAVWGQLLPEMRRNFAFRLSFSPNISWKSPPQPWYALLIQRLVVGPITKSSDQVILRSQLPL